LTLSISNEHTCEASIRPRLKVEAKYFHKLQNASLIFIYLADLHEKNGNLKSKVRKQAIWDVKKKVGGVWLILEFFP